MAGDINVRFMFKLCVIIIATSLNNKKVKNGIIAVAQILVEPRWDTNASQCFVETNTTRGVHIQGSAIETCSLQVRVPQGTHIQLQIPGRNKSLEAAFVYMERNGDLGNCLHKYVAFNEQIETCNSIVIHRNIQVVMRGNTSLFVSNVLAIETFAKCPEEEAIQDSERVGQISRCSNVKGYNERISCDSLNSLQCRIKFPPNCGTVLFYSEVIYQICSHGVVSQSYNALITYSIPGGGAVIFEMDTGVRPTLRQAGAFGESTGSKNEGSLGESMIFGIR